MSPTRRSLVGLGLFALALRLPLLPLHRMAEGDGVHYARLARTALAGDLSGIANPYWSNVWPAVIAASAWLTRLDCATAGRLAALLAGCCLAPAAALLATRAFDRSTGLAAGLLLAIHPWLIHFSTLLFTESWFAFLLVMLLLTSARHPLRTRDVVGAGIWAGLGLTTRFEAFAATLPLALWLLIPEDGLAPLRALRRALVFVTIAAAFVLGRGVLVHHYSGTWDFGGTKGRANLILGLAESDRERARVATEVQDDGQNALAHRSAEQGALLLALQRPRGLARHVWLNSLRLKDAALRVLPLIPIAIGRSAQRLSEWPRLLLGWALALCCLALAGAWQGCLRGGARGIPALLALVMISYVGGLVPLLVHDRLLVPLVPLFAVFVARGWVLGLRLWRRDERLLRRVSWATMALLGALSLERLLDAPALDYASDPVVQRETGEWLKARFAQDTVMMTAAPCVDYYFHDAAHPHGEVTLPWTDYDAVLRQARRQNATLLVVPEWHLRAVQHPALALWHPEMPHPGLWQLVTLEDAGNRMFIYRLLTAAEQR